jgi:hypothetical protein
VCFDGGSILNMGEWLAMVKVGDQVLLSHTDKDEQLLQKDKRL